MTLFDRQVARKPNLYPWTQDYIRTMQKGLWTAQKFTFDSDLTDYELNINDDDRQVIQRDLAAIAQIEVQVKEFWKNIGDWFPHPSISDLGIMMAYIEVVHNDAYEKLLEKLGLSDIFLKNMDVPALAGRVKYLKKHADVIYVNERKQKIYSLILFTLFVENVSLFSQFLILLHMNKFGRLFKDAAQQVKYTRNEELLHAQAGSHIINTLRSEHPELFDDELEARIVEECREAYKAESALIDWIIGDYERIGIAEDGTETPLNSAVLKNYVADRLNISLKGIGYQPVFDVDPDLTKHTEWMEVGLFAPPKVDFFNSEPTGYQQNDQSDNDDF